MRGLLWAISAGSLTALFTLTLPDYYRSESRILPVDSKAGAGLGNLGAAAAAFGINVPGGEGNDSNFVDILQSRWLKERLLQTEFQFLQRTWRFGQPQQRHMTLYAYLRANNLDRAVGALGNVVTVSRDLKSKVITISAETTSPELSQLVVRRVNGLLETFLQEKGRTRGSAKASFAEARLAEARSEMAEAESVFREFLESNRNYSISADPGVRLKGARLEAELRLRQQLVGAIALNREQALLEEKTDIPILNVLDPENLPIEKSRPARGQAVIFAALAAGILACAIENRQRIKGWLFEVDVAREEA